MGKAASRTRPALIVIGLLMCVGMLVYRTPIRSFIHPPPAEISTDTPPVEMPTSTPKEFTVDERIQQYGATVHNRLAPVFHRAGVPYPPAKLVLVGLKQEKRLEIYAAGNDGKFRFVRSYPMLAASGVAGPKLAEGDLQVPEGLYRIESINPNSLFHLSLRVNYPNEFDRAHAANEHRENLGGDIMIHGNAVSIGCMAMGDEPAEDLFILAALTGIEHIQVILCPVDFRLYGMLPTTDDGPVWLAGLYEQIKTELKKYPVVTRTGK